MDDRQLMENMLILEKGGCDLMMHGTIESADPEVKRAFNCSLNSSLQMQGDIYAKMQQKGWYPTQQVEMQKKAAVKQKFNA